jgi:single-strand DNA-binding protein
MSAVPAAATGPVDLTPRNEVRLVGRLGADPVRYELPSGDSIVSFRLTVDRPPGRVLPSGRRAVSVDSLPCAAWDGRVRRAVLRWSEGDIVEVSGALHRRFRRTSDGTATSAFEVNVASARRLARAQ